MAWSCVQFSKSYILLLHASLSSCFPAKNLVGAIPQAICSLSALSTLDLSHTYLIGSIPTSCFAHNLTNLRHLDLSGNSFLNGTMAPISALPHLAYLDLSGNAFDFMPPFQTPRLLLSDIMAGFFNISVFTNGTSNLQHLDLSRNLFASGISNLFTFPLLQLQHLHLSGCGSLSNENIPVTGIISQVPQLRTLFLNFTFLAAEGQQISELLCGLKSLEVLSVPGGHWYLNPDLQPRNFGNLVGELPQPASCKRPLPF